MGPPRLGDILAPAPNDSLVVGDIGTDHGRAQCTLRTGAAGVTGASVRAKSALGRGDHAEATCHACQQEDIAFVV